MNNKKIDVTLGFDLGVGSVGYAIVDNSTNQVLKWGSRLFSEPNTAQDRRGFRSIRRSIRRAKYRNEKFFNLVIRNNDIFGFNTRQEIYDEFRKLTKTYPNILELKLKGLKGLINPKEAVWLLHDYLMNRGFFFTVIDDKTNQEDLKFNNNESSVLPLLPSERLNKFYLKHGFFKEQNKYTASSESKNFSNEDWNKELAVFFENNKYISDKFIEPYLVLFNKIRNFATGPGSKNSPTKYGLWRMFNDNKVDRIGNNLWEQNIGKCSYYPDELRSPNHSTSAEIFNLLNDLNNLRNEYYLEFRLSYDDKIEIINTLLDKFKTKDKKTNFKVQDLKSYLSKFLGESANDDQMFNDKSLGFSRALNNKEVTFTSLDSTFELIKIFKQHEAMLHSIDINNMTWIHDFDSIINVLSKYQSLEDRIKALEQLNIWSNYFASDNLDKLFFDISSSNKIKASQMGNLSNKCHHKFIPLLLEKNHNYQQIRFSEKDQVKNKSSQTHKYLTVSFLEDAILPPAVRSTLLEATKMFNKIKKLYSNIYNITNVVIELAREKNNTDAQNKLKDFNTLMKSRKQFIENQLNVLDPKLKQYVFDNNNDLVIFKLFLYFQQDHIDPYDGKELDLSRVVYDSSYVEIDHIIPYSLSLDNSQTNKVLTKSGNNKIKGQRTPYEFFKNNRNGSWGWNEFEKWCFSKIKNSNSAESEKDTKKKTKDVLFTSQNMRDSKFYNLTIKKFDQNTQKQFMSRNLNDTRYSTKLFRDALIDYSRNHNDEFKVTCVNGYITSYLRTISKIGKKDRNQHSHHAQDAGIIAILCNNTKSLYNKLYLQDTNIELKIYDGKTYKENIYTGELTEIPSDNTSLDKLYDITQIANLINASFETAPEVLFSRKYAPKYNTELFNSTLYSFKDNEDGTSVTKIMKAKLLDKKTNLKKFFGSNASDKDKLLINKNHNSEYKILNEIYLKYENSKENPFIEYINNDLFNNFPEIFTAEQITTLINSGRIPIYNDKTKSFKYFKALRYENGKKEKEGVILTKKQNNRSFKDSLKALGQLIYVSKNGKFAAISINTKILNLTGKKIDFRNESIYKTDELNRLKEILNIPLNQKPYMVINFGSLFIKDNELFYACGFPTRRGIKSSIQIRPLATHVETPSELSTNIFMSDYKLVEIDELGNIYNK
ncbi:type II CRISPR RNA-guided endonuclease Cas9 [Mycoplasma zalophidermidis]|uniref:type II CRISPR RNA-guided endonuclease Cas9 n=1 Tax=Mycoplasma zalophidermidis TaxID=398174 RepID=UPI00215D3D36|nr:type II CRISPR RNA-guided endonuclease Cas9 [Mycoplasma zalophidermidis]MCR8966877.1 type II CRISPR RNA-guided endonuclease Cas9 [Mycoplasma zalophidermidis]